MPDQDFRSSAAPGDVWKSLTREENFPHMSGMIHMGLNQPARLHHISSYDFVRLRGDHILSLAPLDNMHTLLCSVLQQRFVALHLLSHRETTINSLSESLKL